MVYRRHKLLTDAVGKMVVETRIRPLGLSIASASALTGQSVWTIKDKLRRGIYRARKAGRRTIVDFDSVEEDFKSLPRATFAPPAQRKAV